MTGAATWNDRGRAALVPAERPPARSGGPERRETKMRHWVMAAIAAVARERGPAPNEDAPYCDEVVGKWGKPFSGYAPMGCLHGLTTLFYGDVSLAFDGPLLETIHIGLNRTLGGGLSITSSVVRALGTPTSSRRAGNSCCLAYVSSKNGLRLDFSEDQLFGVWLERTPLRAEHEIPGANPQGGANGRQPFSSETNRTPAAAASRRSP